MKRKIGKKTGKIKFTLLPANDGDKGNRNQAKNQILKKNQ